ncbi:MAG: DEAD/DEAH box helicase [Candidatus Poseidoniales archaeon]|jgi:ATP-dependent Lhr-like helicase|nr:DEAD/DEAH box helicase [Candidatus Poseidoniales archaeon]|tara:strand:+ start:3941 stop:6925 length:2985 start_codon:yes stop_codon:yes gene_type:complete
MSKTAMETLHPDVRNLITQLGWKLTPIQEEAMIDLYNGHDRLLVAPTGSGKTEAAILPVVSRALEEKWEGLSILYITPLRALNRDIDRRLSAMLEPLGLTVGLRHGDTTQKERTKQSKNPPNLLITTPETTQIMLLGSRLRKHLSGVKVIILDEIHDLAGNERGAQLMVGLERIADINKGLFQRIGLSATVGNPKEVANYMSKKAEPILGPAPRFTEVVVHKEKTSAEDEILSVQWSVSPNSIAAFRRLANSLINDSPSLIFVNSRSAAETVAQRLSAIVPEIKIGVHHGSLAAETRKDMEDKLRQGELNGIICTSSLELGIDIGSIKRVHQLQSPRAVDRLLQRMGRAEHHLGGTGRGEILAWEVDEISECAVIARKAMAAELEGIEWQTDPGVVAANQFIQLAIERGVVPLEKANQIIKNCSIFKEWNYKSSIGILRVLNDRWLIRLVENPEDSDVTKWPAKLWEELASRSDQDIPTKRPPWDEEQEDLDKIKWRRGMLKVLPESLKNGWFSPSGKASKSRTEHISMIPDEISYRVRDVVTRSVLGSVDEAFVLSLNNDASDDSLGRARRFVMAGRTWQIVDADPEQEELLVAPIKETGEAPVWSGELPPVPKEVAREVGKLRRSIAITLGAVENDDSVVPFEEYPLSPSAREALIYAVSEHIEATGVLPDEKTVTIEDRQGTIVLNTCAGSKINETLAHLIQAFGSLKDGKMGRTLIDPYRISIQIPGTTSSDIIGWLQDTPPIALPSLMRMTIPNGRAVRWRVVQVARRMGVLQKGVDPRKVNLQGLMRRWKGTPVIEEALSKLFHERMDIDSTVDFLTDIQNGDIMILSTPPGPLGQSIKSEKDLLLPSWSDKELREHLEVRLLNERAVLICLNCKNKTRKRVERFPERIESCSTCSGTMQACSPERMESMLIDWVESRDPKVSGKMTKNAELIRTHGKDAVICMMGRGIAEETATRILRGHVFGERVRLLRSIHNAELKYASTRRYWS